MSFSKEYSKESKPALFCSSCGAKIRSRSIFCFECGPPDSPAKEPEESGTTLKQAFIRIAFLLFLFICVVIFKFYITKDTLTSNLNVNREGQSLISKKNIQGDAKLAHIVIAPIVNVRSKPSMKGQIIAIVEEGMNLNVIEKKENWAKVRVFNKTGWIANKLIKIELQDN